ncbi:MAG TPA: cytochrome c3 family protein [Candidatus Acidoferrum sp.]|nr:cytochrome c3 family protein [Candidatus Acidoferrum sp.]
MHAIWVKNNGAGRECATCHSDHNGVDFQLIHWQPNREALDHSQTGFALKGKHVGLKCESCHKAEFVPAAARSGILVKDLNRTFLGLSTECASCHQDAHHGQLGKNCASCHTADGWKPASLFNHAKTKFPLTGAHEKTPCAKCHPTVNEVKPYVKYTGIAFEKCTACHVDPHKGSFSQTCQSCHNTVNWHQIAQLKGFDHSKTKFPLEGKHSTVACSDCHTHGDFKTPIPFAKCMDCHKDPHKGQFLSRPGKGECAECHTVQGWKPSTFTVKDHAATKYPLEGKHADVACEKCHLPKGLHNEDTLFKITKTQCQDCHEDIHKGQFAGPPRLNHCESCHNVKGFKPALFSIAQHKNTRFPLTGAHIAVLCADCHKPGPAGSTIPVKYKFEDRTCTACHEDPHKGEFRAQMEAKRSDGSQAGCEACHTTKTWKELNRFDHSKTEFPLLGAHRGVACIDCHRPPAMETTLKDVDFKAASKKCSGCHVDPHAGQFASRKDVADCSSCHDTARWKPAQFDHDKRTPFSLAGAHRNVACQDCHKVTREVAGKTVLFYKPTPRACSACHGTT